MTYGPRAVRDSMADRFGIFLDGGLGGGGPVVLGVRSGRPGESDAGGRGRRGEACLHDEVSYDTRAPFCTARCQHERTRALRTPPRCQSSPPSGKLRRMRLDRLPISVLRTRYVPGGWDLLAFVLVFAFFVYAAQAARGLAGSLAHLEAVPISLAPSALVGYSARTALRMLIAIDRKSVV